MTSDIIDFGGFCPNCNDPGPLGEACPEKGCTSKGYHYIPTWFRTERRPHPLVGLQLGDYLLVKVLGSGGFGTVFLSYQLPIGLNCALKLLHWEGTTSQADDALHRFRNEAFALARISHPNVVRLIQYGVSSEGPFLVMEYVDSARTLAQELESAPPPWPRTRVHRVVSQLLNGLQAAHDAGVLHRDVKPQNLMLQDALGYPDFIRILDFGLARFAEAQSSSTRASGTPLFLAPEQLDGRGLGPWTDLYAVGVLAFLLLTGHLPYYGQTIAELFREKGDRKVDPASRITDPHLRRAAGDFFRRALAVNTDARYRDVEGFREDFEAALAGIDEQEPTIASPEPTLAPPVLSESDPRWFADGTSPVTGPHAERAPFGAAWIDPPGVMGTLRWFRRIMDFRAVPDSWPFPPQPPLHPYAAIRVRFCRELIATAQNELDLAPLYRSLAESRAFLGRGGAPKLPSEGGDDDPVLRLTFPDALLTATLGLTTRHIMDSVPEEWLHEQPSAVLLLDDEPHSAGQVKRDEPISEFYRWSVRQLTSYRRDEIESAYRQFRAEQRFRATFAEVDEEQRDSVDIFWWTEFHHALSALFHPDCGRTRLLEAAKRFKVPNMPRMIKALQRWRAINTDDPTFLDLPATHGSLVCDGVGPAVLGDLFRLTLSHMRTWRYHRLGLPFPRPPAPIRISLP